MSSANGDYTDLNAIEPETYAFVFICQHGRLEIEAALLAASLRHFNPRNFEIIAAIPQPNKLIAEPERSTLRFFEKLGVTIQPVFNDIIESGCSQSLYTNKIYSLRVPTDAQKLIFLDSDRLCLREFTGDARFAIPFTALPVSYPGSAPYVGRWAEIFRAAEVHLPELRLRVEGQGGKWCYTPPYFNSGLISVDSNHALELSRKWEECFIKIDSSSVIEQRPFTEQISLAVALTYIKIPFSFLDKTFAGNQWSHYFTPGRLRSNWQNNKLARSLLREHPELSEIVMKNEDRSRWEYLLSEMDYIRDTVLVGGKTLVKRVAKRGQ